MSLKCSSYFIIRRVSDILSFFDSDIILVDFHSVFFPQDFCLQWASLYYELIRSSHISQKHKEDYLMHGRPNSGVCDGAEIQNNNNNKNKKRGEIQNEDLITKKNP